MNEPYLQKKEEVQKYAKENRLTKTAESISTRRRTFFQKQSQQSHCWAWGSELFLSL